MYKNFSKSKIESKLGGNGCAGPADGDVALEKESNRTRKSGWRGRWDLKQGNPSQSREISEGCKVPDQIRGPENPFEGFGVKVYVTARGDKEIVKLEIDNNLRLHRKSEQT